MTPTVSPQIVALWNKLWDIYVKNGANAPHRCVDTYNNCVYYDDNSENRCAIGQCLSLETALELSESKWAACSIQDVLAQSDDIANKVASELGWSNGGTIPEDERSHVRTLQTIHDWFRPNEDEDWSNHWRNYLTSIANDWRIPIPG